jgi:hypothetical protein
MGCGIPMALRVIIAMLVFFFAGCKKEQLDDCITSTGPIRTEQRTLAGFHTVDLSDRIDLVLDHMPVSTVEIEGGRNLLDQVVTEVRDGVLYVSNENRCNWVRSFKPRISVKVPIEEVHTLILRGTGNITATDTVRQEIFRIDQWLGIGTVELKVAVQQIYIGLHTGAGDVKLSGHATDNANYYSGIMGTIEASHMRARIVNINNSGIGDIRCWAEEELNVAIHDAGDVYYRGDPITINTNITGSGSLYRID